MGSMLSALSGHSIDSLGKCVPTGKNAAQIAIVLLPVRDTALKGCPQQGFLLETEPDDSH